MRFTRGGTAGYCGGQYTSNSNRPLSYGVSSGAAIIAFKSQITFLCRGGGGGGRKRRAGFDKRSKQVGGGGREGALSRPFFSHTIPTTINSTSAGLGSVRRLEERAAESKE